MELVIIGIMVFIAFAFFGAKKGSKVNSYSDSGYNLHERPIDDGVSDEYYYDTYIKTISLDKRKDYEPRSIVGMTYRYLSMSDLGKFNGFAQAEDDNEFDDFAVAIYNDRGKHLGYIPRDDEEMHEYITDNFGSVNAYGYVAYSENEGYYGEVCIEYLPKDIIT